MSRSKGRT